MGIDSKADSNKINVGFANWLTELEKRVQSRSAKGLGRLSVITGPASSQKTSRLDSIAIDIKMALEFEAKHDTQAYPSALRYYMAGSAERKVRDIYTARRGRKFGQPVSVFRVSDPERVPVLTGGEIDFLLIDDVHLFDERIAEVCEELALKLAVDVFVAGKPLDENGTPYPSMPGVLCLADEIEMRTAICCNCGHTASRTAVVESKDSGPNNQREFQPVCRLCGSSMQLPLLFRDVRRSKLHMIVGPSYAGKTEEFIREVRHYLVAGQREGIQIFYPTSLKGRLPSRIWAYDHRYSSTRVAETIEEVLSKVRSRTTALFIDSVEGFQDIGPETAKTINQLVDQGKDIICTGVELKSSGEPVLGVGHLLCYADRISKLQATCWKCGGLHKAVRITEVDPALGKSRFKVAERGKEYRSICRSCLRQMIAERISEGIPASQSTLMVQVPA